MWQTFVAHENEFGTENGSIVRFCLAVPLPVANSPPILVLLVLVLLPALEPAAARLSFIHF